jgi:hypothetical protein
VNPFRKFSTLETSMGIAMGRTLTVCWFDDQACWEAEVDATRVRVQARA